MNAIDAEVAEPRGSPDEGHRTPSPTISPRPPLKRKRRADPDVPPALGGAVRRDSEASSCLIVWRLGLSSRLSQANKGFVIAIRMESLLSFGDPVLHRNASPHRLSSGRKIRNIFSHVEISAEIGPVCGEVLSGIRPNPLDFNNFRTPQAAQMSILNLNSAGERRYTVRSEGWRICPAKVIWENPSNTSPQRRLVSGIEGTEG